MRSSMYTLEEREKRRIKKLSTKTILNSYKTWNSWGKAQARKELKRRKVKSANLPYKRKRKSSGFYPSFRFRL